MVFAVRREASRAAVHTVLARLQELHPELSPDARWGPVSGRLQGVVMIGPADAGSEAVTALAREAIAEAVGKAEPDLSADQLFEMG